MAAAPQTVKEIQDLLAQHGLEPQRRMGQNFLIDGNLMRMVVEAAQLDPAADVALEIGSGTGSLTTLLAERARRVVTVEADRHLLPILDELFADAPNVTLLAMDALAGKHVIAPEVMAAVQEALASSPPAPSAPQAQPAIDDSAGIVPQFKLVANLPYVIATPLVMNLILGRPRPGLLAFTVQREVAERLGAGVADGEYGAMSVLVQALCEVELLRDLSPTVFWPKPQVFSTLVRMRPVAARYRAIGDLELFHKLVTGLFGHRRKICLKCLELAPGLDAYAGRWPDLLAAAKIDPQVRSDTLPLESILRLNALVQKR